MTQSNERDSYSGSNDHEQTECIEDGCEYGVRYLEEVPNGYRLTCGEHAGEDAVDLAEIDFRPLYDEDHHTRQYNPKEVAALYSVGARVLEFWPVEKGSPQTVSLMLRDGDHEDADPAHEIVGESILYHSPGIYGLVRIGDSSSVEDAKEYIREPAERPEWANIVYRDPPLEHHVSEIECADCGATGSVVPRGSNPSTRNFQRLRHDGDCPNATEEDKERAAEKERADEIWNRTSPSVMALPCIYEEIQELRGLRAEDEWGFLRDPIAERFGRINDALEDRLDPRYPSCPDCGGELKADHEGIVDCTECRYPTIDHDDEAIADVEIAYGEQARRVWGWRGHGGRKPAEVADGE